MQRLELYKRIQLLKQKPEQFSEISNTELAGFVLQVLSQIELVNEAIAAGKVKGDSPIEGGDYLGKTAALALINDAIKSANLTFSKEVQANIINNNNAVSDAIAQIKHGEDGEDAIITDAIKKEIAHAAYSLISLPDFEALITSEPQAIRDALELLTGDARLSIDAIRGLKEEMLRIEQKHNGKHNTTAVITRALGLIPDVNIAGVTNGQVLTYDSTTQKWKAVTPTGGGGTWVRDNVSGTMNGSNTVFTLSQVPVSANSLNLSLARQPQIQGVDYTLSGTTITYVVAPDTSLSGQPHVAQYQ